MGRWMTRRDLRAVEGVAEGSNGRYVEYLDRLWFNTGSVGYVVFSARGHAGACYKICSIISTNDLRRRDTRDRIRVNYREKIPRTESIITNIARRVVMKIKVAWKSAKERKDPCGPSSRVFAWIIIQKRVIIRLKIVTFTFYAGARLLYGPWCKSSDLLWHGTSMHMRGLRVSRADTPRWLRFFRLCLPFLPLSPSTFEFHAIVVLEGCRLRLRCTSRAKEIMDPSVC